MIGNVTNPAIKQLNGNILKEEEKVKMANKRQVMNCLLLIVFFEKFEYSLKSNVTCVIKSNDPKRMTRFSNLMICISFD